MTDSAVPPSPIENVLDPSMMFDLARMPMPFGRFKGRVLIDLPEPYVVWFKKNGYPKGRLGDLLAMLYEVKANGLEPIFDELRNPKRPRNLEHLEPALRYRPK